MAEEEVRRLWVKVQRSCNFKATCREDFQSDQSTMSVQTGNSETQEISLNDGALDLTNFDRQGRFKSRCHVALKDLDPQATEILEPIHLQNGCVRLITRGQRKKILISHTGTNWDEKGDVMVVTLPQKENPRPIVEALVRLIDLHKPTGWF